MASGARFTVTHQTAPRLVVARNVQGMTEHLAADAAENAPRRTGQLAAGFRVERGSNGDPATWVVVNTVSYARFVEYGTRHIPARAPLGRATANAKARMR